MLSTSSRNRAVRFTQAWVFYRQQRIKSPFTNKIPETLEPCRLSSG